MLVLLVPSRALTHRGRIILCRCSRRQPLTPAATQRRLADMRPLLPILATKVGVVHSAGLNTAGRCTDRYLSSAVDCVRSLRPSFSMIASHHGASTDARCCEQFGSQIHTEVAWAGMPSLSVGSCAAYSYSNAGRNHQTQQSCTNWQLGWVLR